jgi:hypothetical protein
MTNQTVSDEQLHSWWKAVVKKHNKMHLDAIQNRHAGIWFTTNNEPMLEAEVLDKVAQAYQHGRADLAKQLIEWMHEQDDIDGRAMGVRRIQKYLIDIKHSPTKEDKG